ncbi:MAG: hypothetical protein ACR2FG_14950 [Marmoricola sp.]
MSTEQFYSRVLRAYPAWYRRSRGDEMLGVLMDSERKPSVRETASLVRHGFALRLLGPGTTQVWSDLAAVAAVGLAGVLAVTGLEVGYVSMWTALHRAGDGFISQPIVDPLWPAAAGWVLTFGLVLLGWARTAACAAWLAVVLQLLVLAGATGLDGSLTASANSSGGPVGIVRLVSPLVLAVLLLRSGRVATGLRLMGRGRLGSLVAIGVVAAFLGAVLALALAVPIYLFRRRLRTSGASLVAIVAFWFYLMPASMDPASRTDSYALPPYAAHGLVPLIVVPLLWLTLPCSGLGARLRRGIAAAAAPVADVAEKDGSAGSAE